MYKKYLIVASKKDKAGINITTNLSQFGEFDFYLVDEEIIYTENLDLEKIEKYDFIIFASKHQSEKKEKTLSIHAPGNWRESRMGGRAISREKDNNPVTTSFQRSDKIKELMTASLKGSNEVGREGEEKICPTSALFQKQIFDKLKSNSEKYNLKNYKVTLECTHHGPAINKPCIFIEIGSTETEWKDRRAGFVVAKTISEIIKEFKKNPYNEVAVGIGGPHYCPNFNKIQLNSNIAISHIIPKYVLPLKDEMIKQALEKTDEEVDFVLLDWKGLGNSEQRQQVTEVLEKLYINYKKTSEINK